MINHLTLQTNCLRYLNLYLDNFSKHHHVGHIAGLNMDPLIEDVFPIKNMVIFQLVMLVRPGRVCSTLPKVQGTAGWKYLASENIHISFDVAVTSISAQGVGETGIPVPERAKTVSFVCVFFVFGNEDRHRNVIYYLLLQYTYYIYYGMNWFHQPGCYHAAYIYRYMYITGRFPY